MSSRFQVPHGSSSPPSTPDRSSRGGAGRGRGAGAANPFAFGEDPSTTPAGPPPSSAGSFTPAGAPTASFLGSSMMRGMTGGSSGGGNGKLQFAGSGGSAGGVMGGRKDLFGGGAGGSVGGSGGAGGLKKKNVVPLGRSIRGKSRGPSRLSREIVTAEEGSEEGSGKEQFGNVAKGGSGTFGVDWDESYEEEDEEEEAEEDEEEEEEVVRKDKGKMHDDYDADLWLGLEGATPRRSRAEMGDESDLMVLNTPAATERVRREAEDIFRATSMQVGTTRRRNYRAAAVAKEMYTHMGTAELTEPPQVILGTEAMINRLYDDGVGERDDAEKLEDTLANAAGGFARLWQGYVEQLEPVEEENTAEIGPGSHASPFEKANYLAHLALVVHHSRCEERGEERPEPLPVTLFDWLNEYHNLYDHQIETVLRHRPSPACHGLFWESVFISLIRGNVETAIKLLENAGWSHVRLTQRGELAYSGQALDNVDAAVEDTIRMLETCPGKDGANWDIWNDDWTLFRVRAQGSLEQLRRFAEGKSSTLDESAFGASTRSRSSMAGLARRAESQVPWEIYENLNVAYDIVLGSKEAIMGAAQDWVEATIGLFGWWDERRPDKHGMAASLSKSQALVLASNGASDVESYLDRLARAFHVVLDSEFHYSSSNPLEVGIASVFEDNIKAVVGLLRGWSLPIASAIAEIASLGRWLPPHQPQGAFGLEGLDMDDLEVLGMNPGLPDEVDGIKDSTLVQYAQALADYNELSNVAQKPGVAKDGWELAINVLGRMDSPERSEEMVGHLVRHLLENLHVDSNATVDRIWTLLNGLGMIPFAEETAEAYGEILKRDSHRYGEAMWYYALAHRPNKVRDVMNLLISYSLLQSTAYPPINELDDYLHRLLADRNKTLEKFAKQDLEAAELLGKMLSGYASLRQFYDIRDSGDSSTAARQEAAAALVSVIASSDDNIRGGLYDQTRDGIVSEDFLLVLLGEATAFVTNPDNPHIHLGQASEPAITPDHIDTMLKALEDLHEVGDRVRNACEEFLQIVLAAAPGGLKGSTPADLLKSTGKSGSYALGGSSVMVSQLQKSLGPGAAPAKNVKRGWDWRKDMPADTKGERVMKRLRLGLAKDLASLWLAEADGAVW